MKVALVHDWLITYAGAERVLHQILQCYPDADIFTVVDFLDDSARQKYFSGKTATTTFIQKLPLAKKYYRYYLRLMPLAIEQLDVSQYDLVISSSHAVAKGIITSPNQLHVSYVHSPIRYAWDMYHQYLQESNLTSGIKSLVTRMMLHKIRLWDVRTANGVDDFIANSKFIAKRIWKCYRREASVINPPVDTNYFNVETSIPKEDFYLTVSRMVPYKKIDLIVNAFTKMPDKKLVVIGDGPLMKKIRAVSGDNVELLGFGEDALVRQYMQKARAFVFAAEEDFGITPLEAQACGTPVIAYAKGGCLETIKDMGEGDAATGVFFNEQTEAAIISAVARFEKVAIAPQHCRKNAEGFSEANFRERFKKFIEEKYKKFVDHA